MLTTPEGIQPTGVIILNTSIRVLALLTIHSLTHIHSMTYIEKLNDMEIYDITFTGCKPANILININFKIFFNLTKK